MGSLNIGGIPLVCRRATLGDYQGVIQCNEDVFAGLDYMSANYYPLICRKGVRFYVACLQDKIIGFHYESDILEGKQVYMNAERVHPLYQHMGVSTALQEFAKIETLKIYPQGYFFGYAAVKSDFHAIRLQSREYSLLAEWNILNVQGRTAQAKKHAAAINLDAETREVGISDIPHISNDVAWNKNLFPLRIYYQERVPLYPSQENIRLSILRSRSFVTYDNAKTCRSISFTSATKCKFGARLDLFFYCCKRCTLENHIILSLQSLLPVLISDKFSMFIYCPKMIDTKVILDHLRQIIGTTEGPHMSRGSLIVVEKHIAPIAEY